MLVVILQRQRIFGTYQVVQIGHGLVSDEVCRLGDENILRKIKGWREIGICRRNHVLAVGQRVVQHGVGDRIDGEWPIRARRIRRDHSGHATWLVRSAAWPVVVGDGSQRRRAAIGAKSERHGRA